MLLMGIVSCSPQLGAPDSGVAYRFTNGCGTSVSVTPSAGGITETLAEGEATVFRGLDEFVGQSTFVISLPGSTSEVLLTPAASDVELSGDLCPLMQD